MKFISAWPIKIFSIACILSFLAAPSWCDNGKHQAKPTIIQQNGEGLARDLETDKVSIAKKSLENVTTTAGVRYAITDDTIIIGMDGHQVSTQKMLVPCDAEISFEMEQGRRNAVYIRMKRIGRNASVLWTSEKAD